MFPFGQIVSPPTAPLVHQSGSSWPCWPPAPSPPRSVSAFGVVGQPPASNTSNNDADFGYFEYRQLSAPTQHPPQFYRPAISSISSSSIGRGRGYQMQQQQQRTHSVTDYAIYEDAPTPTMLDGDSGFCVDEMHDNAFAEVLAYEEQSKCNSTSPEILQDNNFDDVWISPDCPPLELLRRNKLKGRTTFNSSQTPFTRRHCSFCKGSEKVPPNYYKTHTIRDANGDVTCPVLQSYTCPNCGKTGHTKRYCDVKIVLTRPGSSASRGGGGDSGYRPMGGPGNMPSRPSSASFVTRMDFNSQPIY